MAVSIAGFQYQKPKTLYATYLVLYSANPNIPLGTAEPTTPTLSITVTSLPSVSGDTPKRLRYYAVIIANLHNSSGAVGVAHTGRVRTVVPGKYNYLLSATQYHGDFVSYFFCYPNIELNDGINIYAWASASGFWLRTTVVVLGVMPVLSDKYATVFAVRTERYVIPNAATSIFTRPAIHLCHGDVNEASLGDAGAAVLRGVANPSLRVFVDTGTGGAASGAGFPLNFVYPAIVVWTE
jgi:hypothetical protein